MTKEKQIKRNLQHLRDASDLLETYRDFLDEKDQELIDTGCIILETETEILYRDLMPNQDEEQ